MLARPALQISTHHPVYLRERQRWQRLNIWTWLRWGCLPLILLFLLVILSFPVFCYLLIGSNSCGGLSGALLILGVALWGLQIGLTWLLSILATIGGALTIAPERQVLSWELLRLTPQPVRAILGNKLLAVLAQIWPIAGTLFILRLSVLLIGGALLWMEFGSSLPSLFELPAEELNLITIYSIAGLIYLLGWLLGPAWRALYPALLGVLASSFTRSINAALGLAFGLLIVIGIVVYGFMQYLILIATAIGGEQFIETPLGPLVLISLNVIILLLAQFAVAGGASWFSIRRADTLLN